MEHNEFRKKFMYMDIGEGIINCVDNDVVEGIDNLSKLVEKSEVYQEYNKILFKQFRAIPRFTGFVVNNKLGADNLFYDLNISGYENTNTEHIDEEINPMFDDINTKLNQLLVDVKNTFSAVELYRRKNGLEEKIKLNLKNLLGGEINDAKFSADELLAMDITAIAEAYGLDTEKLKKFLEERSKKDKYIDDILSEVFGDQFNNLSEEEKKKFKETAIYISDGFNNDKEELSVGKMGEAAEKVSLYNDAERLSINATSLETSNVDNQANTNQANTNQATNQSNTQTTNSSQNTKTSSEKEYASANSSRGAVSYRKASSSSTPTTSNVKSASSEMESQKADMRKATEQSVKTKAFDKTTTNNQSNSKNSTQNNRKSNNQKNSSTQSNTNNKTNTNRTNNSSQPNNNKQQLKNTKQENTTDNTINKQTSTQKITKPVEILQATKASQPLSSISTAISKGQKVISDVKDTIDSTITKATPAKLVSSVTNNTAPMKPINIGKVESQRSSESNISKFVPPIAGLSTAGVAGIGTKLYMNSKEEKQEDKSDTEKDNKQTINVSEEADSKMTYASKEDILKMLEK